jgi:hypothetical protein
MIVSCRASKCAVRGMQRNDCVWLYVELYSTPGHELEKCVWSHVQTYSIWPATRRVVCSNVQDRIPQCSKHSRLGMARDLISPTFEPVSHGRYSEQSTDWPVRSSNSGCVSRFFFSPKP